MPDETLPSSLPPIPEGVPAADGQTGAQVRFDPRYTDSFHGLAYIGALTDTFEYLGHKFVISTLNTHRELAIAKVIKDWEGTAFYQRAYVTAVAAMCVETVDGQGMPTPIGESNNTYDWAFQRFDYATARWYRWVVDKIYTQYLVLEDQVRQVLDEMGKASGQVSPTPGSSESSDTWSDEDS
jgi:hypothetical protein